MDIGPLWIGRDEDDPLLPAAIKAEDRKHEAVPVKDNTAVSSQKIYNVGAGITSVFLRPEHRLQSSV